MVCLPIETFILKAIPVFLSFKTKPMRTDPKENTLQVPIMNLGFKNKYTNSWRNKGLIHVDTVVLQVSQLCSINHDRGYLKP